MATDPELKESEIGDQGARRWPEQMTDAEEQALLQDIDLILARIDVGIAAQKKAMAELLERLGCSAPSTDP
jgi:hypothetical protein